MNESPVSLVAEGSRDEQVLRRLLGQANARQPFVLILYDYRAGARRRRYAVALRGISAAASWETRWCSDLARRLVHMLPLAA
jgi:hypothetical protein